MKLFKQAVFSIAAATVLCAAPMARADVLSTQGFAAGAQTLGLNIGPSVVYAGGFKGTWNSQSIIFWCIELTQYFGFGNSYVDYASAPESAPEPLSDAVMTLLDQLFTEAYPDALHNATNSAAFQLAIWEIIYDSGSMNLGSGSLFVINDHSHGASVTQAQTWLTNIGSSTDDYQLFLLRSDRYQDFVTFGHPFQAQTVPEPATLMLLVAALLAVIVALRRRECRIDA
jgi:PEP-CTERM motif